MTENEAKLLEKLDELANDTEVDMYSVANLNFFFEESANTIRKLIEEIQQYRAIGTPTQIFEKIGGLDVELGKYRVIGTVEDIKKGIKQSEEEFDMLMQYRNIGTIEECRVAMNCKNYFSELYGEGLEVANWHQNGDLEPFDNFYDESLIVATN